MIETRVHRLPRRLVTDREAWITDRCRGKSVLHLGFVAHPYMDENVASGRWLHTRIAEVASRVVGVDWAAEEVATLQGRGDIGRVVTGDVERLPEQGLGHFDVIVAGEILEHLTSPGAALDGARESLVPGGELIVTVPNAFCLRRMIQIPAGREVVHPDHVSYYSHRTLARLLEVHGMRVTFAAGYRVPPGGSRNAYWLDRIASWLSPNLCEGIAVVAQPA